MAYIYTVMFSSQLLGVNCWWLNKSCLSRPFKRNRMALGKREKRAYEQKVGVWGERKENKRCRCQRVLNGQRTGLLKVHSTVHTSRPSLILQAGALS